MSKINETNYPRRTQANYADTDMLVLQAAGGNTYTTRIEDMRDDYEATLAPTIDKINDALAPAENGATASQAYAAGEHFMRDGAYCTAIGSGISSGGSFTLNTNYKTGTVADDVESLNSDLTPQDVSSSFKSSDTDLTLTYAIKVNGFVYLVCQISNVTTSNSQYIKEVMSSNRPAALTPVMVFSGSATNPVVSACIDKWGQIIIRSGSASVSNMSYYVMAIYRV